MDLKSILNPERITEVVDIGANPIDGAPPYKAMLGAGLCRVTGFEPQIDAWRKLQETRGPNERYLLAAVGDGTDQTLHICHARGMTSFYKPDPITLSAFNDFTALGAVVAETQLRGNRLDDIPEIEAMDFLKMDVQGAELTIISCAQRTLRDSVAIQLEVSFVALYQDQPTIGSVDQMLRKLGFIPHCFAAVKRWPISPARVNGTSRTPVNQLLEADLVYVRDFRRYECMTAEQWKHLALIAHYCYGSFDLVLRALTMLAEASVIPPDGPELYKRSIPALSPC